MTGDDQPHEIVIIRRRHDGDHDDAHGGVWKVAFADFMTAMMAFFLVLWIVNSTSKETRASVARYFNPVRLSDTTPARKGLQEPREEDFDASVKAVVDASKKASGHDESSAHDVTETTAPASSPALAKPASATMSPHAGSPAGAAPREPGTGPVISAKAPAGPAFVETFRDPFEPLMPSRATQRPDKDAAPGLLPSSAAEAGASAHDGANGSVGAAALEKRVAAITRTIGSDGVPAIEVRDTPEGTLLSLTDRADYGMFDVGSAEPNKALVRLMTSLGGLLKTGDAPIVIRGHTDARRFRTPGFDNWRLSTSRAQAACDMLLRGGLDERRVERVEGYADHRPRNAKSPDAAENRRIEILLRRSAS